jgi:hypothetical protein
MEKAAKLMQCISAEDGNCQFEALSVFRFGTRSKWNEVKKLAIRELGQAVDHYQKIYHDGVLLTDYIAKLSDKTTNEWGCGVTLSAMCNCWHVKIVVITATPGGTYAHMIKPDLVVTDPSEKLLCYTLLLQDNHYEVLFNESQVDHTWI